MTHIEQEMEEAENTFSEAELAELTSKESLAELANMQAAVKLDWLKNFYIKVRPALKSIAAWLFWRPKLKALIEAFIIAMDEIFNISDSVKVS